MDKRISYYVVESDDTVYVKGYSSDDSADRFFTDVSRALTFDGCSDDRVLEIIWHGKPVYYAGWASGMLYQYYSKSGKLVWEGRFPEWDH